MRKIKVFYYILSFLFFLIGLGVFLTQLLITNINTEILMFIYLFLAILFIINSSSYITMYISFYNSKNKFKLLGSVIYITINLMLSIVCLLIVFFIHWIFYVYTGGLSI